MENKEKFLIIYDSAKDIYVKAEDEWTTEIEEAMVFVSVSELAQCIKAWYEVDPKLEIILIEADHIITYKEIKRYGTNLLF